MVRDLSQYGQPLGSLVESSWSSSDLRSFQLTAEQIALYHQNGYLGGLKILATEQVEILRDELATFFEPHKGRELWYEYHSNESTDPEKVLFHALGAWRIAPGFHDLLWNPAVTVPASQLLGGAVRFWHDQLFCKPAHHGGVVAWHQDYSYWTRTHPMAHLTCWIALDDSRVDNGCIHYVPGSHNWDLLPITGLAGNMDAIKNVLNDDQWEQFQNPVAVEVKAGECSIHHPLTIHGSFENQTDQPRRATVLNLVKDGVCSVSDEPLLQGVPPIASGEPLSGQFFPLLLAASEVTCALG